MYFNLDVINYRYQARAEEERQKYDAEMASYRQASLGGLGEN
jgi:hypothetical protein